MNTTPDNSQLINDHNRDLIECYAQKAIGIGSAVQAIADVMTNDLSTPALSGGDKIGLMEALRIIGEVSVEVGDRIESLCESQQQGEQTND